MSMLLLSLAAAAASLGQARPCPQPATERVAARTPMRPHRLGEMPPAKQVLTVYRSIDGCPTLVVVRDEVGANGRR